VSHLDLSTYPGEIWEALSDLRLSLDLFADRCRIGAHQPSPKPPNRSAMSVARSNSSSVQIVQAVWHTVNHRDLKPAYRWNSSITSAPSRRCLPRRPTVYSSSPALRPRSFTDPFPSRRIQGSWPQWRVVNHGSTSDQYFQFRVLQARSPYESHPGFRPRWERFRSLAGGLDC